MGTSIDIVSWKSVNGTRGITKAVTLDGIYRPISNQFIESLKCRCDEYDIVQKLSDIVAGDRVKIERGPFAEFICNVDKIKDNQRAWVLIDLLQKQTRADIPLAHLSKKN